MTDIITTIFEVIGQAVTKFVAVLTNAVGSITEMFYVPAGSGETSGHMTFLGVLLLIVAGIGIVYWCFRLIKGLVKRV